MKVTGGATLHAPVASVWAALNDPAVLVQAIPGCERLTATGQDSYELTVTAGVGTITGTYTGQIALADQQPPTALTLQASGSGSPGTVATTVLVQLSDNSNETLLRYDADATIGGLIAGVGQRMLAAAAKRQATQFFTALDELLLMQAEGGAAAVPPGEAVGTVPGQSPVGAAGVSSPTGAATRGASGMTWERSTAGGQPAGRRGAGPQPAGLRGAGPPNASFLQGAIVGAAIALAGVVVGGLIARRNR